MMKLQKLPPRTALGKAMYDKLYCPEEGPFVMVDIGWSELELAIWNSIQEPVPQDNLPEIDLHSETRKLLKSK